TAFDIAALPAWGLYRLATHGRKHRYPHALRIVLLIAYATTDEGTRVPDHVRRYRGVNSYTFYNRENLERAFEAFVTHIASKCQNADSCSADDVEAALVQYADGLRSK